MTHADPTEADRGRIACRGRCADFTHEPGVKLADVVYFMPPYTASDAQIDLMVGVAAEGIESATCG